jgi:hypothetical protein
MIMVTKDAKIRACKLLQTPWRNTIFLYTLRGIGTGPLSRKGRLADHSSVAALPSHVLVVDSTYRITHHTSAGREFVRGPTRG